MQLTTIKNIYYLLCCLSTSLLITGCNYQPKTDIRNDVLIYCSEGSPETFNPQLSSSGVTFDASSRRIYNRLVDFKPNTLSIQPSLAESWTISPNGKTYTFKLRRNVEFHTNQYFKPSRSFNADDVLFSFERQWLKQHPYHQISNGKYPYFNTLGLGSLIKSIVKIDSHTIQFNLHRADSPFLSTLAMDFASILSAEYAQKLLEKGEPNDLDNKPIGTGPFQLVRYQTDEFIRYKTHKAYWQTPVKFNHLVFAITPDPSVRFARTVAGECDLMANPLPVHLVSSKKFKELQMITQQNLNVAYLTMNTQKSPFDNHLVRLALNHAINKQSIIKVVYQGTATTAVSVIPPQMWAYDSSLKDYNYDLNKSKELLTQAGYPNGFKTKIWVMSAQRPYNPNAKKMAELIQESLRKININIEIVSYEYSSFLSEVRQGKHPLALMGWSADNGDPDNFYSNLLTCEATTTGYNNAFWCDPIFSELILEARSENKIETRKKLYNRAEKRFKQAAPWVPIAHAKESVIFNQRVKNININPATGISFKDIYLTKKTLDKDRNE